LQKLISSALHEAVASLIIQQLIGLPNSSECPLCPSIPHLCPISCTAVDTLHKLLSKIGNLLINT